MLFFTLAPVFSGRQASATARSLGAYNPDAQIHAAWMLWRTGDALPPGRREAVLEAYSNRTPTPPIPPIHHLPLTPALTLSLAPEPSPEPSP